MLAVLSSKNKPHLTPEFMVWLVELSQGSSNPTFSRMQPQCRQIAGHEPSSIWWSRLSRDSTFTGSVCRHLSALRLTNVFFSSNFARNPLILIFEHCRTAMSCNVQEIRRQSNRFKTTVCECFQCCHVALPTALPVLSRAQSVLGSRKHNQLNNKIKFSHVARFFHFVFLIWAWNCNIENQAFICF